MLHVGRRGVEVISDSINNIITPRDGLIAPDVVFHSRHNTRASEGGGEIKDVANFALRKYLQIAKRITW